MSQYSLIQIHFWSLIMQKIYQFTSLNNHIIQVDEKQPSADEIVIRCHFDDQLFTVPFDRKEFEEISYLLNYRLSFPAVEKLTEQ
jgi:hypothetical protein